MKHLLLLFGMVWAAKEPTFIKIKPDTLTPVKTIFESISDSNLIDESGFGIDMDKTEAQQIPINFFDKPYTIPKNDSEIVDLDQHVDAYPEDEPKDIVENLGLTFKPINYTVPTFYPPIPEKLTKHYLMENITHFFNDLKTCVNSHFKAPPEEVIAFRDILDDCVGIKGARVKHYESDIYILARRFLTDSIFDRVSEGFCDEDFSACVEFFRSIQLFSELGLDVKKCLKINKDQLLSFLPEDKLNFLEEISSKVVDGFSEINNHYSEQKKFIRHFLVIKKTQYYQDYPAPPQPKSVRKKLAPPLPPEPSTVTLDFDSPEPTPPQPYVVDKDSAANEAVFSEKKAISLIESGWVIENVKKNPRSNGLPSPRKTLGETEEGFKRKQMLDELLSKPDSLNKIFL